MLKFKSLPVFMGVLAGLFVASPASGSILQALDLDELVAQSDQILLGKVVFSESFQRPNGALGTWHRIQIERDLRGNAAEEREVIVETLGGRMGDVAMQVAGEPTFVVGERVVLFAREGRGRASLRPVGMAQGVMRIRELGGIETVSQSRAGMMLLRRDASGRWQKSRGALPSVERLDIFLREVRAIVERQSGSADE
jgi:hypothetical protein